MASRTITQPDTIDDNGYAVMVTGHRDIEHPELVADRCWYVLCKLAGQHGLITAISGGAQGADTIWAQSAIDTGNRLAIYFPNRYYNQFYPKSIGADLVRAASEVRHIVERPDVADWRDAWTAGKWWVDNFARNTAMIKAADLAVVISPTNPRELVKADKGGTAATVKELAKRGANILWIPDRPDKNVVWIDLGEEDPAEVRARKAAETTTSGEEQ